MCRLVSSGAVGVRFLALALGAPAPAVAQAIDFEHADHAPALFHQVIVELDREALTGEAVTWNVEGWIGGDAERVWLRSEGTIAEDRVAPAEAQLYYGWNVHPFWDVLVGLRHDFAPDQETWAAASLVGLAPLFIETEVSLFVSPAGLVALRLEGGIDIPLTQRLIAEPHLALNLHAQDLPAREIGTGLSDIEAELQLRWELARRFAPYATLSWERALGETAQIARAAGEDAAETALRLGLRVWF